MKMWYALLACMMVVQCAIAMEVEVDLENEFEGLQNQVFGDQAQEVANQFFSDDVKQNKALCVIVQKEFDDNPLASSIKASYHRGKLEGNANSLVSAGHLLASILVKKEEKNKEQKEAIDRQKGKVQNKKRELKVETNKGICYRMLAAASTVGGVVATIWALVQEFQGQDPQTSINCYCPPLPDNASLGL